MKAFQHFDPEALAGESQHAEAAKLSKAAKPQGFRQFQPAKPHLKLAKAGETLGNFSHGLAAQKPQKTSALSALATLARVSREKRIVLLQAPDGVPIEWVQGVADLLAMSPPPDWSGDAWKVLQLDATAFLQGWAAQAHRLDWSTQDLFSVHADGPRARLDGAGLIPLLRGIPVVALADTCASIKASRGTLTYRRRQTWPPECCLIWELGAAL